MHRYSSCPKLKLLVALGLGGIAMYTAHEKREYQQEQLANWEKSISEIENLIFRGDYNGARDNIAMSMEQIEEYSDSSWRCIDPEKVKEINSTLNNLNDSIPDERYFLASK